MPALCLLPQLCFVVLVYVLLTHVCGFTDNSHTLPSDIEGCTVSFLDADRVLFCSAAGVQPSSIGKPNTADAAYNM